MRALNRREFLGQGLCYALGSATLLAQPAARLNFIIFLIDDLGWKDLGCYGSAFYETPNVDRLAARGMRFTDAYAACPVCSPTRASILTGKYPARLQLTDWIPGRKQWPAARLLAPQFEQQLPLAEVTLAEALKPAGYVSASIGKWHLGQEPYYPEKQGFDLNVGGTDRGSPPSYFPPYRIPGLEPRFDHDYLTDNLTDRAERFIESNRERPFFLYLSHFAVHLPLGAKQEGTAKYQGKVRPGREPNNATYAAMVEGIDDSVGRILKKLDELGIAGRTVVFFLSDNGGLRYEGSRKDPITANAPLRAGKGHLYEGGIRIPLIVSWPGKVTPGSVSDAPVSTVDLYPTLLEMAGAKRYSGHPIDGVSLAPLLRKTGGLKRSALYWHYPHYSNQGGAPGGAVRSGDFKLIEFYEDGRLELYNLKEDIGERNNLAGKLPQKAAGLHRRLASWRQSVGATMAPPNPNYDPLKADQGLTGTEPHDP